MRAILDRKPVRTAGAILCAFVAAASFSLGSTSALFSASETGGTNTFATGTVSVGLGATSTTCSVANLMPGDSSTNFGSGSAAHAPCDFRVRYTGTAPAWLAADIAVAAGSPALFTGAATGLQFKVAVNGGPTLLDGTTVTSQAGATVPVVAGTPATNLLVSAAPAAPGDLVRFDIDFLLPLLAPNSLQGGSAALTVTFRAVQSANQPLGTCLAGRQCTSITWG